MAIPSGRSGGFDVQQQFRNLQVIQHHIRQQEDFLKMIDQEESIPDMARRLSKEAISGDLSSNKRLFLDYLYNLVAAAAGQEWLIDVEFHYIMIGKEFFDVDKCILWYEQMDLMMPIEIGEKFGKVIVGSEMIDAPKKILAYYKEAEARFDRDFTRNLDRCSLVILEEIYPTSSYHIKMRLPATILNDIPISL